MYNVLCIIQIKSKVLCKTNVPTFVPTLGTYFCAYFNIVNFPMYGGFPAKATYGAVSLGCGCEREVVTLTLLLRYKDKVKSKVSKERDKGYSQSQDQVKFKVEVEGQGQGKGQ